MKEGEKEMLSQVDVITLNSIEEVVSQETDKSKIKLIIENGKDRPEEKAVIIIFKRNEDATSTAAILTNNPLLRKKSGARNSLGVYKSQKRRNLAGFSEFGEKFLLLKEKIFC